MSGSSSRTCAGGLPSPAEDPQARGGRSSSRTVLRGAQRGCCGPVSTRHCSSSCSRPTGCRCTTPAGRSAPHVWCSKRRRCSAGYPESTVLVPGPDAVRASTTGWAVPSTGSPWCERCGGLPARAPPIARACRGDARRGRAHSTPLETGLPNPRGELLGELASLAVGILPRRRLHQVGRWPLQRPSDPAVEGQLGVADRVDHHPGAVLAVPDLHLYLDVQRNISE